MLTTLAAALAGISSFVLQSNLPDPETCEAFAAEMAPALKQAAGARNVLYSCLGNAAVFSLDADTKRLLPDFFERDAEIVPIQVETKVPITVMVRKTDGAAITTVPMTVMVSRWREYTFRVRYADEAECRSLVGGLEDIVARALIDRDWSSLAPGGPYFKSCVATNDGWRPVIVDLGEERVQQKARVDAAIAAVSYMVLQSNLPTRETCEAFTNEVAPVLKDAIGAQNVLAYCVGNTPVFSSDAAGGRLLPAFFDRHAEDVAVTVTESMQVNHAVRVTDGRQFWTVTRTAIRRHSVDSTTKIAFSSEEECRDGLNLIWGAELVLTRGFASADGPFFKSCVQDGELWRVIVADLGM